MKKEKNKSLGETVEAFATVHSENGYEAYIDDLVPISDEYDRRSRVGEEKSFRMLPRSFVTALLRIEGNAMFSEDRFTEPEQKVLEGFVEKKLVKSAIVAGKKLYFDLASKFRKYLVYVLTKRDSP